MEYYIINNASRAASYGIGTYIRQLTLVLKNLHFLQIYFIDLGAEVVEFSMVKDEDGLVHYKVPMASGRMENDKYCRMAYYLLSPYLPENEPAIFHFNYFQHYPFASLIKSRNIHHRVFLSVHYLNWCFELNGNVLSFKKIVNAKTPEAKYRSIMRDFLQNKHFLHLADEIITLSHFCKYLLLSDYEVSSDKVQIIYNGLQEDTDQVDSAEVKNQLVLFVGRLDKIKGVDYLIDAFRLVLKRHENASLVIVGDGDYDEYLKHCKGIRNNVIFTGKLSQDELLGFYRQALIGVLPSFHEQCSYTAIEFMKHGIPFVGTDSTGLKEMLDSVPSLRVHISETNFSAKEFTTNIANAICSLLDDETARENASQIFVAQFKEKYTLKVMEGRLLELINSQEFVTNPLSQDFLQELDEYMISLIHEKVDIDTDFYGMSGIGVYLWWRVESDQMQDEVKSFMIKEYLIYYLDWLYETAKAEQRNSCDVEIAVTLNKMRNAGFYKTIVDSLMKMFHCKCAPETINQLSPFVILQNAMRMFTTKIQ